MKNPEQGKTSQRFIGSRSHQDTQTTSQPLRMPPVYAQPPFQGPSVYARPPPFAYGDQDLDPFAAAPGIIPPR
jgi:hypothetical protein